MSDKPCPCCGHDDVAVNLAIKDILEQNETLRAERTAHAAEVERLTAERDALQSIVNDCMGILGMTQTAWDGTDIPRGESDLPRWVRDVADASYRKGKERDAAVARAERAEDQLATIFGLAFDAEVDACGKDFALEQIRKISFGDTTIPHPGNDWRKRTERLEEALEWFANVDNYMHPREESPEPGPAVLCYGLQMARDAIAAASDKPQYAAPELVPVYPGPDLQRGDIVYTPRGERAEVYNFLDSGTLTSRGQFCASVLRRGKPKAALSPEPWGGPEGEEE